MTDPRGASEAHHAGGSCRRHTPLAPSFAQPHPCPPQVRRRVLGETPFFSGLGSEELAEVDRRFVAHAYAAHTTLCRAGDPARHLFVLGAGRVKLTRHPDVGCDIVVDVVLPGAMFGALPGGTHPTYGETAETLTGCCVLAIPVEQFKELLQAHPDVAAAVIGSLSDHLSRARAALARLGTPSVEQRIAATVLALVERAGHDRPDMTLVQVPLARVDLAAMCGTTTESVSRTLSRWRRAGVIESGRRWVVRTSMRCVPSPAARARTDRPARTAVRPETSTNCRKGTTRSSALDRTHGRRTRCAVVPHWQAHDLPPD